MKVEAVGCSSRRALMRNKESSLPGLMYMYNECYVHVQCTCLMSCQASGVVIVHVYTCICTHGSVPR